MQPASLRYQNSEGTCASDDPSLRGGGRVNVRIDLAFLESSRFECLDFFLEIVGDRRAHVGADGDGRALGGVVAITDGWPGRLNKKDRKHLGFTIADIERAVGVAYTGLGFVSLRLVSLGLASRGVNGGSVDGDDEDGADDGEELCRKHRGVG